MMTERERSAIRLLGLISELSPRNSYEDYRGAVSEIVEAAIDCLIDNPDDVKGRE